MPIRHARTDDIAPLGALLDGYRVFYGQASDPDAAQRFVARRLGLGDSHLLVHEDDDDSLAGFVQCYPLFSTVRLAPLWRLNDLFVAPETRGRGVGRALMQAAAELARAHDVKHLALATGIDNHTAQSLYESEGWRRDRAFHHYALDLDA
ncbi:GNAT family N-acetyltransferase [Halomonas nitroreducens]|uniref:GNAT family N-acetyltransferase n=1 Tax=Halomonas nitroreducens TaxID=447425 RepID=A0A3S0HS27_9GAMM|nr:GNAT family N-acetyltransferase [Halomonas nitroreducens]RTR01113.1 GNAT family N-acetyltransferase [Halomonas nitroreducens]